nr:succinylglutamate desuccinylase/aspartoacylase family protein [uncultured Neokomagataea sp.]
MSCKAGLRHHPIRLRKTVLSEELFPQRPSLPPVVLLPPDLSAWNVTNTDIPGVITFEANDPGPDLVITGLLHGNEFAGGHALERLRRAPPTLPSGRLTLILANLEAFQRFNVRQPLAARYLEEDMNRVWNTHRLRGSETSYELRRAREIEPFIRRADLLLDLHSTLWPSEPFFIAPHVKRSMDFASGLASAQGLPSAIVSDLGHQGGARLIEYDRFAATVGAGRGCLLEAGQHWLPETLRMMEQTVEVFLQNTEKLHLHAKTRGPQQIVHSFCVTDNVVARSADFTFTQLWEGGTTIPHAGTVIAHDGRDVICTPYDDCVLIIPNHRPYRGQLAVRLARRTAW